MPNLARTIEPPSGNVTADEFYDWANHNPGKYQLVDGQIRAMSPASHVHGRIQANLSYRLMRHLDRPDTPCHVVIEPAIQVKVRAQHNRRVPDLGVTCSPAEMGVVEMPDPVLLIEILSASNKEETWSNVWAYTTIPSLQEILIVTSYRIEAQLLRRGADGAWPAEPELIEADGTVEFASIGLRMPLAAAYSKTYLQKDQP